MLRKKTGRVLAWVMSFTMLLSLTVVPVSATEITGDTDVVEAVMEDVIVEDETTAMEAESDAEETNVSEAEDDTGANTVSKTENLTDETTGQDESAVDETEGTTAVSTEEIFDDKTNDLTETEISVVEEETEETFTVESIETVAESESTVTETVQAQIDALPTADEVAVMDLNGQNEVYAAFLAACEAYDALSENEQAQVDDAALYELSDYFNGLITVATDTFQIGDTIYASWSDAIAAATDGATIILLRSVTYSSSSVLTVTAGKNVILDLNGYTLSKTYSETSTSSLITNNGTLTIKDSSEDKTGTISVIASNTSTISSAGVFLAAIRNAGILNLNGGTIKASTKSTSSKMLLWCVVNTTSNAGVVLDGASIVVEKTSTYYSSYGIYNNADNTSIEVKSGSISVSSPASASTAGIGTNTGCSSSSITMSGGTIEVNCTRDSNIATAYYGILAESGSTTVTGGEIKLHSKGGAYGIKANEDNPAVVNDLTMNVSTETTSSSLSYYLMQYAYIYDGTYTMTDATNLSAAVGEGVIATGGTYSNDITPVLYEESGGWIAEGYTNIDNGNGTYSIGLPENEVFTVYYVHSGEEEDVSAQEITVGKDTCYNSGTGTYDLTQYVPEGYLYAGLYTSETFSTSTAATNQCGVDFEYNENDNNTYYVKLVSDSYFQVKCLYSYVDNQINSLWPVMGIDSENYAGYGFLINNNANVLNTSDTAYTSLTIELEAYESTSTTCKDAFGVEGYLGVLKLESSALSNYADTNGKITLTIQPYYVTLDGVMVTGVISRTVTFENGYAGANFTGYTDTTVVSTTSKYSSGDKSNETEAAEKDSAEAVENAEATIQTASLSAMSTRTSGSSTTAVSGTGSGTSMLPGGLIIENEYVIIDITYEAQLVHNGELYTMYKTLEEAIAAAESGDVITLLSDVTVEELTEIKSSQNITLNLATYTITGEMSTRMFAVSGTLTIQASDGGKIINTGSSNAISNGGTLVIESGEIVADTAYAIYNTGTPTINGGTVTGGISNTGYALYNAGGTATINGGTLTSTNSTVGAVRNNSTLIINDGTVGDTTKDIYGVYNAGTAIVNGGTLSGSTAGLINTTSSSVVTVNGGTFQGGKRGLYNSNGTADIYGGIFTGTEYGLMTNSPDTNVSTVYAGTFHGGSRAIVGYLTSTIADCSAITSGSYDQTDCAVEIVKFAVTLVYPDGKAAVQLIKIDTNAESYDPTQYVPEGYLYGGLYYDEACTSAVDSGENNGVEFVHSTDDASAYYIKLVSDAYFQVKCLYSYVDNKITNLWPLIGIDSDSYYKYGFLIDNEEVEVDEDEGNTTAASGSSNTVYKSVTINLEGYDGTTKTCYEAFGVDGYLGILKMDADFLAAYADEDTGTITFTITPFFVTNDGVMVTGVVERTIIFENGYAGAGFTGYEDNTVEATTKLYIESGSFIPLDYSISVASLELASDYLVEDDSGTDKERVVYTITKYDGGEVYTQTIAAEETDYTISYVGQADRVFAGWFTDEDYTIAADFSNICGDMTVYAKYVSADYLVAKAATLTSRGSLTGIRAVAAVDSTSYAEVGFDYEFSNGTSISVVVTKYSTTVSGSTAKKLYGGDVTSSAKLIYNDLSVSGLEAGTQITITPYWVTLDGTRVTGTANTITYTEGGIE